MNDPTYFSELNHLLQQQDRAIPVILIDLDRLDHNLQLLQSQLHPTKDLRIVVKSLPCIPLIEYIQSYFSTNKLMVFDQAILSKISAHFGATVDVLMGKPMPAKTASYYYLFASKDQERPKIQWLIDTEDRLQAYIQLSRQVKERIWVNLELDIGLHRGGFKSLEDLDRCLSIIENVPDQLEFSGFMGYEPHIAKIPKWVRSVPKSLNKSNTFYQECIELLREKHPRLWSKSLTFNGGGSLTFSLHQETSPLNEIGLGSCLIKPSDFDHPFLKDFQEACFIATPILKKEKPTQIAGLERWAGTIALFKPSFKNAYFIYGGHWLADYCYPSDAKTNALFGPSTNQSLVNSKNRDLKVGDFIFLRPTQSEAVLRQFAIILAFRATGEVHSWNPL